MNKKLFNFTSIIIILSLFSLIGIGVAFGKPKASIVGKKKSNTKKILYKPPLRGMPRNRIFGGSRGKKSNEIYLTVIAPDHTGFTVNAAPKLYWCSDAEIEKPVEFSLVDPNFPQPVIEIIIEEKVKKGIHGVSLENHKINLKLGIEYQWSVAIIINSDDRSKDIVSTSHIQRINNMKVDRSNSEPDKELEIITEFAEKGIWYTMFDRLYLLSLNHPDSIEIRKLLQDSLIQIDLGPVAEFVNQAIKIK